MKTVACVASFATALVVGVACLALLLFLDWRADTSRVTGAYQPPFIYAGLPVVVFLGVSVAFSYWRLLAARVFAIVSVVACFGPLLFMLATIRYWGTLIGFLAIAALSLLANWYTASLVRRQLEQAPDSSVNADAAQ
jgi:hypothetical protein